MRVVAVKPSVAERCPEAAIIVPPRSTAVPSETMPTQRDRYRQGIAEHGRAAWQNASSYTKRPPAEAAIGLRTGSTVATIAAGRMAPAIGAKLETMLSAIPLAACSGNPPIDGFPSQPWGIQSRGVVVQMTAGQRGTSYGPGSPRQRHND